MRTALLLSASTLVLAAIGMVAADELAPAKTTDKSSSRTTNAPATDAAAAKDAASKSAAKKNGKGADKAAAKEPAATAKNSDDEAAIRKTGESFSKAYGDGDAKAVANHYTDDAEYIDENGNVFHGRQAIEELLTAFFADNPGSQLEVNIDTIRFISPEVAVEEGSTMVVGQGGVTSDRSRYTAVHVKSDGKWLTATARDHASKVHRGRAEQLQQLEWLVGDWVDEADDSIVEFSCKALHNGNYLVRDFTVKIAGEATLSGSQRIGWDALTGRLRAWTFDSEGGYGEGTWHRDGDSWILKSTGVTADGQTASGTSIFTFVNDHTLTWQAVDHDHDGVRLPDSELFTLVRKPPAPTSTEDPSTDE